MPEFSKPVPNSFCWIELNTTDPTAAKKFYGDLFGWKMSDMPMPNGTYTMGSIGDKNVIGLMQLPEEAKKMGAPPHWLSYVAVGSAADAVKKAQGLGAKVLMGPMDLKGPGIMALLQDPTGGVFAVWQATADMGKWLYGETGALCWNELTTENVDAAGKFYTTMFGWKPEPWNMGDISYTVFKNGEAPAGGMMPTPAAMKGAPPVWTAYFQVANADQTVNRAKQLGANILVPPSDIPEVGRFAILQDPQGAAFAVLQPPAKK